VDRYQIGITMQTAIWLIGRLL